MRRTSKLLSSCARRYLLTPTITSAAESIFAYRRAADSSMRNFGIPETIALVIPPNSSTSSIILSASSARCEVKVSITQGVRATGRPACFGHCAQPLQGGAHALRGAHSADEGGASGARFSALAIYDWTRIETMNRHRQERGPSSPPLRS